MAHTDIRCTHALPNGETCDRFLAQVAGSKLRIFCPKCKDWHEIAIVDLVRHLALEVETHAAGQEDQRLLL